MFFEKNSYRKYFLCHSSLDVVFFAIDYLDGEVVVCNHVSVCLIVDVSDYVNMG